MARVDFYVLRASGESARQHFACRLAEKAWRLENTVHIEVQDQDVARQIDDLLWTFRDGSFVPHEVVTSSTSSHGVPVTVGFEMTPPADRDLLINLAAGDPLVRESSDVSCPRVAEIVSADDASRQLSRQRFVAYRDNGHTLETHKL